MKHFKEHELKGWYDKYNSRFLADLDAFRGTVPVRNIRIFISDCGRNLGSSKSRHNFDEWGEVLAADVIPYIFEDGKRRGLTQIEAAVFYGHAALYFDGIGCYPTWKYGDDIQGGFHLDHRRETGRVTARWGWLGDTDNNGNKQYTGFSEALEGWNV